MTENIETKTVTMTEEQFNELLDRVKPQTAPMPVKSSDEIGAIAGALATAMGETSNPPRNKEVTVKTKQGYTYKFKYATFDAIIDCIRKPLSKNEIWFTQTLRKVNNHDILTTTLMHSSGQWLSSECLLMAEGSGNQAFGSALTYMKRYALSSMLGISADEDDDGNAGDGNDASEVKKGSNSTKNSTATTKKNAEPPKSTAKTSMTPEQEKARADAGKIAAELKASKSLDEVNKVWNDWQPALEEIKEVSEKAFTDLKKRYESVMYHFAQAPDDKEAK